MSAPKFTPGPWRWEVSHSRRFDARVEVTKDTGGHGHPVVALVENTQDAHIVAAAPELLAALEYVLGELEVSRPEGVDAARYFTALDLARAAIAKATKP